MVFEKHGKIFALSKKVQVCSQLPPLKRSKSWTVISPERRLGRREMICYFAFRWPRRNRLRIPWGGGCRKAKSIHLRWVGFLKAMSWSIIAYFGLLQPQFQLPSCFSSPSSQRRWKKISSSAFSAPRAKRAVISYSRTYPHSKAGTIPLKREGLKG